MWDNIKALLETIQESYHETAMANNFDPRSQDTFDRNLHTVRQGHYMQIRLPNTSTWGYVVLDEYTKFRPGDVLLTNSRDEPSNTVRGNVYDGVKDVHYSSARVNSI